MNDTQTASVGPSDDSPSTDQPALDPRDVFIVSQPTVLDEIVAERARQDIKWGEQNHPDGTSWDHYVFQRDVAQLETDEAAKAGEVTWTHILVEEVLEALAEDDSEKLRVELVQVAAIAVQWIEAIDRRAGV